MQATEVLPGKWQSELSQILDMKVYMIYEFDDEGRAQFRLKFDNSFLQRTWSLIDGIWKAKWEQPADNQILFLPKGGTSNPTRFMERFLKMVGLKINYEQFLSSVALVAWKKAGKDTRQPVQLRMVDKDLIYLENTVLRRVG